MSNAVCATVAVVIPVYNGRRHIVETVKSALTQTAPAAAVVVVEDGSRVPSADLLEHLPGVTYLTQRNTGVSGARNHGATVTSADWVCFLDQDDLLLPEHLQQIGNALETNPEADIVYAPRVLLRERDGRWITEAAQPMPSSAELKKVLLHRCPFPPSGVCIRRDLFHALGGFHDRYNLAEDWEFWLRCLRQGCRFHRCDEPTVGYRVHPQSNSHRPLPILKANTTVIRECIMPSLPWALAFVHGSRLISRQQADAAVLLRQLHQPGASAMMVRSIARWPFGQYRRYKIAGHMLLSALLPQHAGKASVSAR